MKSALYILFTLILLSSCDDSGNKNSELNNNITTVTTKEKPMQINKYNYGLDIVMGNFNPEIHPDFKRIPAKYADRKGLYMHQDALSAYANMYKAAKKDGINLIIKSATRNFLYQKRIWEKKWNGETLLSGSINANKQFKDPKKRATEILKYSSMPNTSRHHWGTDIDLNAFNNKYFEEGTGLQVYDWLSNNAKKYGFARPYTKKGSDRTTGYEEEKWHWSYLPVANVLTQLAKDSLSNKTIVGFDGADLAEEIDVVNNYVLGISKDCLP